jgi:uncharacterized cupin superfamily protein
MKPVVNIDDVEFIASEKGEVYEERYAALGETVGAKKLGYNVTVVPPGKRSCPFHNHHVNEEMFFILAGEGTYRFGDTSYPVKAGDVMAAPAGGADTAHHLVNTGPVDLRYLAVSTMLDPDVCEYPDSGKFLVRSSTTGATLRYIGRTANSLDYFDGEI